MRAQWADVAGNVVEGCSCGNRPAWRDGLCGPCWQLADDARIVRELQAAEVGGRVDLGGGVWLVKTGPGDFYARRPGALDFGE